MVIFVFGEICVSVLFRSKKITWARSLLIRILRYALTHGIQIETSNAYLFVFQ